MMIITFISFIIFMVSCVLTEMLIILVIVAHKTCRCSSSIAFSCRKTSDLIKMLFATLIQALAFMHGVASQLEPTLWRHCLSKTLLLRQMICLHSAALFDESTECYANVATSVCLVLIRIQTTESVAVKGKRTTDGSCLILDCGRKLLYRIIMLELSESWTRYTSNVHARINLPTMVHASAKGRFSCIVVLLAGQFMQGFSLDKTKDEVKVEFQD
ncbi:hypothetical protein QQP08_015391 [Theobroma cacao]|nr:hypothetical protein QQP08_015391 [Theobroma cacao]